MRKAFLLLSVFGLSSSLLAADPVVGTWKLNLDKSIFRPDDPIAPAEEIDTYREMSNGQIELTVKFLGKDGSSDLLVMTYPIQGGIAKIQKGNPPVSYVQTRIAQDEWYVTVLMDGKQIGTRHKKISKDGKIMHHTLRGLDDKGIPFEELLVFEKQ